MVQEQAGEGEKPEEEDQEQAGMEVQPAIPALEASPQAGPTLRRDGNRGFNG